MTGSQALPSRAPWRVQVRERKAQPVFADARGSSAVPKEGRGRLLRPRSSWAGIPSWCPCREWEGGATWGDGDQFPRASAGLCSGKPCSCSFGRNQEEKRLLVPVHFMRPLDWSDMIWDVSVPWFGSRMFLKGHLLKAWSHPVALLGGS